MARDSLPILLDYLYNGTAEKSHLDSILVLAEQRKKAGQMDRGTYQAILEKVGESMK